MNPSSDDEQIWVFLRERSLQPGGFGEDRARIWPALLGAQPLSDPPPYSEVDSANEHGDPMEQGTAEPAADPHTDERQIKLDTDRSFVLYPVESDTTPARDALKDDLHELLVLLFRKRRSLHYFQGFHDIMTVLFLTLPRPLHLACAEKMALHRVRDAMGVGLEPVVGLLRVLRNLLRLADPAYAKLLESTSPLPYHALSHLLTLFSHDVPTLPLIQHVWDFLLSREPIAVVWLAAALILHRKPSIYLLVEQDEEGMIHSLLGGIPELVDAEQEVLDASTHVSQDILSEADRVVDHEAALSTASCPNVEGPISLEHLHSEVVDASLAFPNMNGQMRVSEEVHGQHANNVIPSDVLPSHNRPQVGHSDTESTPLLEATAQDTAGDSQLSTLEIASSIPLPESRPASPILSPKLSSYVRATMPSPQGVHSTHTRSRLHSSSLSSAHSPLVESPTLTNGLASHLGKLLTGKPRNKPAPLPLIYLLRRADELLTMYPPSHPSLHITEIMGADSVMRTWRPFPISTKTRDSSPEKQLYKKTDDYLETLVNSSRIVIPSPPPSPRLSAKKTKVSPRAPSKALLDPRRIGFRLGTLTPAERRVLFIGALLVVGAAVALKSSKVPCVDGIVKASGGDALKRLWNGKWTAISSVVAAWGQGLP